MRGSRQRRSGQCRRVVCDIQIRRYSPGLPHEFGRDGMPRGTHGPRRIYADPAQCPGGALATDLNEATERARIRTKAQLRGNSPTTVVEFPIRLPRPVREVGGNHGDPISGCVQGIRLLHDPWVGREVARCDQADVVHCGRTIAIGARRCAQQSVQNTRAGNPRQSSVPRRAVPPDLGRQHD